MKKLYNARSKYVHSGQKIPHDCLFELREFVRKVLIKVADLGLFVAKGNTDADYYVYNYIPCSEA